MTTSQANVVIGKKQVLKQLKAGNLTEVNVAIDVQNEYADEIIATARQMGVPYSRNGTMEQISAQYGIDVPSGTVGVLKKPL